MVEQISKTRRACNKNNIPACPFHLVPKRKHDMGVITLSNQKLDYYI